MTPGSQRASLGGGSPLEFIGLKNKLADNNGDGGEALGPRGLRVVLATVASPEMLGPTETTAWTHGWTHGHADTQPQPRAGRFLQDHFTVFCPEMSPECLLCQSLPKAMGKLSQPGVFLAPRLHSCSAACRKEPENETPGLSPFPSRCAHARPCTCCRQPKTKP